ncbi:alpha/beta fold hydrolase [Novosphingobium album (ex Hu et al. 2023)]|uniref:Alpha/beta hydrolase n=1 Tax=Novosphingobium album (ex Hu et al. 2023) TaxID=2930093 RepID=A0ABT0AYW5_9SPHN|nr:alpha/beta hydrolase [Novosphingobium album (ex Hu et al. 2023)]MCJ2177997.1 alpha/beta hydrolase [Novosphingobium album (ex Hu et al. 2023)]
MERQVLFVHGAPGDARTWAPVIDALPAGIDARAITLSYFGRAEWPGDGGDFGTRRHCDDVVGYVEAMMGPPVDVVAWSFGCHPVLLAAIERPELFASLTLYEPSLATYVEDEEALARFAADCEEAFVPVFTMMEKGGVEAVIDLIIDNAGGAGFSASVDPQRRAHYADSARVFPLMMGQGEPPVKISASDLGRIACPVTVGFGENTRAMFEVPSRGAVRALRFGRLKQVERADHMLPEKDPVRFASLVANWLN